MYVKVYRMSGGWNWDIRGENGQRISVGVGYSTKSKAQQTAERIFDGEFTKLKVSGNRTVSSFYETYTK